jgi:Tol biopolymer transport system component
MDKMKVLVAGLLVLANATSVAAPGDTELISILPDAPVVSTDPNEGAVGIGAPPLSGDGRFVAFASHASNLVPGDTNDLHDVFVRDRATGATTRISVRSDGSQLAGYPNYSYVGSMGRDGRYVTFETEANGVVPGDTDGSFDVFVRDMIDGSTTRVGVGSAGLPPDGGSSHGAISASGSRVAFLSWASNLINGDTNGVTDVFVRDLARGTIERVNLNTTGQQANGPSYKLAISGDGRYVAFDSFASNLVPGDGNGDNDVFVRDRVTGTTTLISLDADGAQWKTPNFWMQPSISDDGRFVAFDGGPGGTILIRDLATGVTIDPGIVGDSPKISADGRYVAFSSWNSNLVADDTNSTKDVFVYDRISGEVARVSVSSSRGQADDISELPFISADGSTISFYSRSDRLVDGDANLREDVFVHNRHSGITERIETEPYTTYTPSLRSGLGNGNTVSADGRFVAFTSSAGNLVSGDTNNGPDLFVRDRTMGTVSRVSVHSSGRESDARGVEDPSISANGQYVAFTSWSEDLVDDDTNHSGDVFVHDRSTGMTTRVSVNSSGEQGDRDSRYPFISADGRYVAFESFANNLVDGDQYSFAELYLHDRATGVTTRPSITTGAVWISGNNRYLVLTNFHITVIDRLTGASTLVDLRGCCALADGPAGKASISGDGRYVAFASSATNLVAGDTNGRRDIFVRDLTTGPITRVVAGNGHSDNAAISADGRKISFVSAASDLVPGDNNGALDVFVVDRVTGTVRRASVAGDGTEADGASYTPTLAAGGGFVVFTSEATNLTPATQDANGLPDVYIHEIDLGPPVTAFQQATGGTVSIEAEHFDASLPGSVLAPWRVVDGLRSSGGAAVQADSTWPRTTTAPEAPRNEYRVNFHRTGPHYVWVRARAYSRFADAFAIALDDGPLHARHVEPDDFQWVWIRGWTTLNVDSVGVHTFHLYRLERNVWVDKIVITPWPDFTPKWAGPPESVRAQ